MVLATFWAFWPRAVPVDAIEVSRGALEEVVSEEGQARVDDVYVVSAPTSGHVKRIQVEAGDCVLAAQTELLSIQPPTAPTLDARTVAQLQASVSAARASVNAAAADVQAKLSSLNRAESDHQRVQKLAETGTVALQALDNSTSDLKTVQASYEAAQVMLNMAKSDLRRAEAALRPASLARKSEPLSITSPINGTELRVLRESEGPI